MADRTDQVVALLTSIDSTLKQLLAQTRSRRAANDVASDRDLDGPHGDPTVKFMPRDWSGPSYKNRKFSECPAELLDMLAETFDYFAQQAEEKNEEYNGKPVAPYKRADARRARGWAKRIRDGKHKPPALEPVGAGEGWGDPSWP